MPGPRRTDFKKPKNAKKTFGRILQYAGKSKFMLLAVFVMLIASTVCSVGASYWLKPILNDIDASIRAGNFATPGAPASSACGSRCPPQRRGSALFCLHSAEC